MNQRRHLRDRQRAVKQARMARSSRELSSHKTREELEEESEILHAQIGELEGFIAGSPFRDSAQRFANRNLVPPPDAKRSKRPQASSREEEPEVRRLSRQQRQAQIQERHNHLFTFFCLFLAVCAVIYWLLNAAD